MENDSLKDGATELPSFEKYNVIEKIGEGGYGVVYKAVQISTGQEVAIKTIKFTEEIDDQRKKHQVARFERETNLCAQISHPNIVKLLDKGYSAAAEPYAVFEYVSGTTLKEYIANSEGISPVEAGALMEQVLDALVCAHGLGIVHRDLKPQNIMVSKSGTKSFVKILDFGIGTFTQEFRTVDYRTLTLTQEVLGTPNYSAPEQLRGEPPTIKSDLYAWGLIMLECLTSQPAIKGNTIAEVYQKQLNPLNISLPPAIVGHPVAGVLRRVLEKKTQLRTGDTQQVLTDYSAINFSTLTGDIKQQQVAQDDGLEDETIVGSIGHISSVTEKKQITVLCLKLNVTKNEGCELDIETVDTIHKDQLNTCVDTATQFGGTVVGTIANHIMVYFGYPEVADSDARRAGRTALELIGQIQKRSAILLKQHNINLTLQVGMNSGSVVVYQNNLPEGNVPNKAFEMMYQAKLGSVLVSETTKKLLEPYLEFQVVEKEDAVGVADTKPFYLLLGERQTEALSFLRPWSTNRGLVGRAEEDSLIRTAWSTVGDGKGQAVLIKGQAGIGKSRLAYEMKRDLRLQGVLVRECRSLPEHQNNALHPFLQMLKNHWGMVEGDSVQNIAVLEQALTDAGCELSTAIPMLCSWLGISAPEGYMMPALMPLEQKKLLFEILQSCIRSLDSNDAFLLVVEDLHWLDPTSLEFVNLLLTSQGSERFMLLMTARPTFEAAWEMDYLTKIELSVLAPVSVHEFVSNMVGNSTVSPKALQYITDKADGIPLFVEELTNMLLENRYLYLEGKSYVLTNNIDAKDVPVTLKDLLYARLEKLGLAKETAQLAATIGREFDYDLLVEASLKDEDIVQQELNQLIDADIIYRQRKVSGESYIFKHSLIRDAAYDSMAATHRKRAHQEITLSIEMHFTEILENSPQTVAYHYEGCEEFEKAQGYWFQAALVNGQKSGGTNETVLYLEKAQQYSDYISEEIPRAESKIRIHNMLGTTLMYTVGPMDPRVMENYNGAHTLAVEKAIDVALKFETLNSIAFLKFNSGDFAGALSISEELAKTPVDQVPPTHQVATNLNDAGLYYIRGEFGKVLDICTRTYELAKGIDEKTYAMMTGSSPTLLLKTYEFIVNLLIGNVDKAEALMEQALIDSKEFGMDIMVSVIHSQSAVTYMIKSCLLPDAEKELAMALEHIEKADEIAKKNNLFFIILSCNLLREGVALIQQTPESEQVYLDTFAQSGLVAFKDWYMVFAVNYLVGKKSYEKASAMIEDGIASCLATNAHFALTYYYALKAVVASETGDDKAETYFKEAIEASIQQNNQWTRLQTAYQYANWSTENGLSNDSQQLLSDAKAIFESSEEVKNTSIWSKVM